MTPDGYGGPSTSPRDPQSWNRYSYDASNKRVARQKTDGSQEFYFYGVDGKKLGTYIVTAFTAGYPGTLQLAMSSTNIYFAGKLIQSRNGAVVMDRLGSVRQGPGAYPTVPERYYPYGDEYARGQRITR